MGMGKGFERKRARKEIGREGQCKRHVKKKMQEGKKSTCLRALLVASGDTREEGV